MFHIAFSAIERHGFDPVSKVEFSPILTKWSPLVWLKEQHRAHSQLIQHNLPFNLTPFEVYTENYSTSAQMKWHASDYQNGDISPHFVIVPGVQCNSEILQNPGVVFVGFGAFKVHKSFPRDLHKQSTTLTTPNHPKHPAYSVRFWRI